MERYLNTGIKEVIQGFPEVGAILEQYGIGCVTCSAGTCLLKDVVQIHRLPQEQETVLMAKINKAIYPEHSVEEQASLPIVASEAPRTGPVKPKYSPPLKKLVEEHERIKRLLALIPALGDGISKGEIDHKLVHDCIYFIRNYADQFHHAKEEEILFKYCDENQDIIQVMLREHQNGRSLVQSIVAGLESGNEQQVIEGLTGYRDLLQQHIQKEDQILYPWIDRSLSTTQVGSLFARFGEVNSAHARKLGEDINVRFETFLKTIEAKFNQEEE